MKNTDLKTVRIGDTLVWRQLDGVARGIVAGNPQPSIARKQLLVPTTVFHRGRRRHAIAYAKEILEIIPQEDVAEVHAGPRHM